MTREEAYKCILGNGFHIDCNANDFFYYATAMMVRISVDDMSWILPIVEKYGDDGMNACMAYIQNQEPIKPWRTDRFEEAIVELKQLSPLVYGDMDCDEYYNNSDETYRKIGAGWEKYQ